MRRRTTTIFIDLFQREYRLAAQAGDWKTCKRVALALQRLRLSTRDAGEALYAQGYASEKLGGRRRHLLRDSTNALQAPCEGERPTGSARAETAVERSRAIPH